MCQHTGGMHQSYTRDQGGKTNNRRLGMQGEQLAAHFLQQQGCKVLAQNWRHGKLGELDLVVQDGTALVAVEVKTRTSCSHGHPFEAITQRKAERLRRLLFAWAKEHRPHASTLRVDAIGIIWAAESEPQIEHLRAIA